MGRNGSGGKTAILMDKELKGSGKNLGRTNHGSGASSSHGAFIIRKTRNYSQTRDDSMKVLATSSCSGQFLKISNPKGGQEGTKSRSANVADE